MPITTRIPGQLRVALVALVSISCLAFGAASAAPAADASGPIAHSSALRVATVARTNAEHNLASQVKGLKKCLREHPGHCARRARSVRLARQAVAATQARIARLEPSSHKITHFPSKAPTPVSKPSESTGSTGSTSAPAETPAPVKSPAPAETVPVEAAPPVKTAPVETPVAETPAPTESRTFEVGDVTGSAPVWELPFLKQLGAHTARMEFTITTPASQLGPAIEAYARAGIRPLLLTTFDGTIPSPAEAQSLKTVAADYGPGGSFWQGKNLPANTAVTDIEFGNETSYSYQYAESSATAYATRAQTYAVRVKEAQEAIHAANPQVGLLAQADSGGEGSAWVKNMFKAVPNLGQYVAGWTVHPYGPNWQTKMDEVVSQTQAAGASSSIPLYVTEWGLSTDNGRCLDNNYGWNTCMTYSEAAQTLGSTVTAMRTRYGTRLAAVYLYETLDEAATGTSVDREDYFGALQINGATKGSYTTEIQSLFSTNP